MENREGKEIGEKKQQGLGKQRLEINMDKLKGNSVSEERKQKIKTGIVIKTRERKQTKKCGENPSLQKQHF